MTSVQNHLLPLSGNKKFFLKRIASSILLFFVLLQANAKDKDWNIAFILPFNASEINADVVLEQSAFARANFAIDYYRGAKLALDSLSKKGYTFQVRVFDSKSDSNELKTIARDPDLLKAEYIFAALTPAEITLLIKHNPFLKSKIISALSPAIDKSWKQKDVLVAGNTLEDHAKAMARYIYKLKPSNYVILRSGLLAETRYAKAFVQQMDSLDKKITHKEILSNKEGYAPVIAQLSKTKENYIVIPSGDQAYAIKLFKFLEDLKDNYRINLIVHPVWIDYQTIDPKLFLKYKVHTTSSYFVDYNDSSVNEFVQKYRSSFYTEPTELSFKAFDQQFFYLTAYDNSFLKSTYQYDGLGTRYQYSTKADWGRNKALYILLFSEEGLIRLQ